MTSYDSDLVSSASVEVTKAARLRIVGNLKARQIAETNGLQHLVSGVVDLKAVGLNGRDIRDVVILALTLLLLQLEGDATDGTLLDTSHEMGNVTSNLVSHLLGGDDGNLLSESLVGLEVKGQSRVVLLDDDAGSALDGL